MQSSSLKAEEGGLFVGKHCRLNSRVEGWSLISDQISFLPGCPSVPCTKRQKSMLALVGDGGGEGCHTIVVYIVHEPGVCGETKIQSWGVLSYKGIAETSSSKLLGVKENSGECTCLAHGGPRFHPWHHLSTTRSEH